VGFNLPKADPKGVGMLPGESASASFRSKAVFQVFRAPNVNHKNLPQQLEALERKP